MRFEQFFGPGNDIRWAELAAPAGADTRSQLQPFLDLVTSNAPVAALPRVHEGTKDTSWYVLWRHERDARFAYDLVRAFVGPSYSTFGGLPPVLDPGDAVERAVLDAFGANALRIDVPREFRKRVRERLLRMAELLRDRPARSGRRWRAVGRILRDFEFALAQGDAAAATQSLDELREGGYLDAVNLAYLDLRRLAAAHRWADVLSHPLLPTVLEVGVPRRVAESVLRAVYHQHLAPFQSGAQALAAREYLREVVLPAYHVLFRTRQALVGPEVDVAFLLFDAVREQPNATVTEVLARYPAGSELHAFLGAIATLLPPAAGVAGPTPPDPLALAAGAFEEGDVDAAFALAARAPTSLRRTRLLVRSALEMDTDAPLVTALDAVDALPPGEREALLLPDAWRQKIDRIRARVGAPSAAPSVPAQTLPVVSWEAWFVRLRDDAPWPGAVACAEMSGPSWPVEALAGSPDAVSAVHAVIEGQLPPWGAQALRGALPAIVRAVAPPEPDPRLLPILQVLFDLLATDDAVSVPLCTALVQVARPCLHAGVGTLRFREVLEGIAGAVAAVATPLAVPSVLEAFDMVLSVGCPDEAVRKAFGARLASVLARWWRRLEFADQILARDLLSDLGVHDALPPAHAAGEQGPRSPWQALNGRSIAVYSLNEGALRRAGRTLQAACASVRISLFHDLVGGSPALREKARAADLFVVVTGAATHAATTFIEANRARDRATAYASGQGSSGILAAVREWLSRMS